MNEKFEKIIVEYKDNTYYFDFIIDKEYEFEQIKFVVTSQELWIDKEEKDFELGVSSSKVRTMATYKDGHLKVGSFEEPRYTCGYLIEESPIIYKYNRDIIKFSFK